MVPLTGTMASQLIPWRELDDAANEFVPGYGEARAYRNLMCDIRRQNPTMFTIGMIATATQNPINAIQAATGMWDRICETVPLPPAAQQNQPWIGGACAVPYNVFFYVRDQAGNITQGSQTVTGPIERLYFETTRPYVIAGRTRLQGFVKGSGGPLLPVLDYTYDEPATVENWLKVERADGEDDNCGNVPPQFDIPPQPFPSAYIIPVVLSGQERPVTITLPGLDQTNFPLIRFEPTFNIDGVPVRATPEGIEIDWPDSYPMSRPVEPGREFEIRLEPTFNNTLTTVNNTNQLIADLSELTELVDTRTQTILNELEECCSKEYEYILQPIVANTAGGTYTLPPDTIAVRVEMVGEPTGKTGGMRGPGTSPDVWFWGWGCFGYLGAAPSVREPLHFLDQTFRAQEDAVTFTVGPTYLNRAKLTAILKVRIEPEVEEA